jgi:hypothetical protein
MALDEDKLAVVLQVSIDKAGELLVAEGGFLPFATRVAPDGAIEFVQFALESEGETMAQLYERLVEAIAEEARASGLLGSGIVAHAQVPGAEGETVIAVLVEMPGYSRMITVPYRLAEGAIELGSMTPQEASPAVFAG